MNEELKTYLEGMEERLDQRFTGIDEQFRGVNERLADLDGDIAKIGETTGKILYQLDSRLNEQEEITSDAGLGGRVGKLEGQMKRVVEKLAI